MPVTTNGNRITRDDLQAAFAEVIGEGEAVTQETMPKVVVAAGATVLLFVAFGYLAGRRRGRKMSAIVEIRRV